MDPETQARDNLSRLITLYAEKVQLAPSTVQARALNDARFLDRTASGEKTFTFRLYREALRWFSDNWPDGAEWPGEIPRLDSATGIAAGAPESEPCS